MLLRYPNRRLPCTPLLLYRGDLNCALPRVPRSYPESYKRRGQSRSALGDLKGALSDLKECIRRSSNFPFSPSDAGSAKQNQVSPWCFYFAYGQLM